MTHAICDTTPSHASASRPGHKRDRVSLGMHRASLTPPKSKGATGWSGGAHNDELQVLSMNARSGDVSVEDHAFEPVDAGYEPLSVQNTIRRYHDSLIQFLRQRLRVPEDAFDVAQEAYIRMMQYQDSRQIRSPSSMLFRIAINVANDLGRAELARGAANQCSVDDLDIVSDAPSVERQLTASEDLALLYTVIEELPPKCRQVFLLSRVRRMTYGQIAVRCGISKKMVEKHISHALAVCMRNVSENI
jgi:RNA polymerase sigma factor (sigma-70 family)